MWEEPFKGTLRFIEGLSKLEGCVAKAKLVAPLFRKPDSSVAEVTSASFLSEFGISSFLLPWNLGDLCSIDLLLESHSHVSSRLLSFS